MPVIPIILIIIGVVLIVSGVRGKSGDVGKILADDFSGGSSFTYWIIAVILVGIVASFSQSRKLGTAFFSLMLVVLFLSNGGFFAKFQSQIR